MALSADDYLRTWRPQMSDFEPNELADGLPIKRTPQVPCRIPDCRLPAQWSVSQKGGGSLFYCWGHRPQKGSP